MHLHATTLHTHKTQHYFTHYTKALAKLFTVNNYFRLEWITFILYKKIQKCSQTWSCLSHISMLFVTEVLFAVKTVCWGSLGEFFIPIMVLANDSSTTDAANSKPVTAACCGIGTDPVLGSQAHLRASIFVVAQQMQLITITCKKPPASVFYCMWTSIIILIKSFHDQSWKFYIPDVMLKGFKQLYYKQTYSSSPTRLQTPMVQHVRDSWQFINH